MFCSNCGFAIGESNFCSNCGAARLQNVEPKPNSHQAEPTRQPSTSARRFALTTPVKIAIGIGVAALALVAAASLGAFENRDIAACKALVKDSLKSPSSARFLDASIETIKDGETGEPAVSIKGEVEAENGFGARVVGEYWCTDFDTEELELEYLTNR